MSTDPVDVPCCCDCGAELEADVYGIRDVTPPRDPWAAGGPDLPLERVEVVEMLCLPCYVKGVVG